MSSKLQLSFTRDFSLTWADWWMQLANVELAKAFGEGFDNQLVHFNGLLSETYRPESDAERFMQAVYDLGPDTDFLSNVQCQHVGERAEQFRRALKNADGTDMNAARTFVSESMMELAALYPWYMVFFWLPLDRWARPYINLFPDKSSEVIERAIIGRRNVEGLIGYADMYWRAVAGTLLEASGISKDYSHLIRRRELLDMLNGINPSEQSLEDRSKEYIIYHDKLDTETSFDGYLKQNEFEFTSDKVVANLIKGTVAYKGDTVEGEVQVILRNKDIDSFREGNILVTIMTSPYYIPALKKAKAVITNEGGITCHAAITARELKKPTIIGTKQATAAFKDGDIIRVDTESGVVTKL